MNKINIELQLEPAEWDVLYERTRRAYPDIKKEMEDLRRFMYENLYTDSIAKIEEKKVPVLLKILYQYYEQHIDEMPDEYVQLISNGEAEPRVVCDYISGMTDPYAVQKFEELFIPKSWPKQ